MFPQMMLYLPVCSEVICGAPRLVTDAHRLLPALQGLLLALSGMLSVLPDVPLVVTRAPMSTQSLCHCSQVHLKAAALVQSTLCFNHPRFLV